MESTKKNPRYQAASFSLSPSFLQTVTRLNFGQTLLGLVCVWTALAVLILAARFLISAPTTFWLTYPVVAFLIAGRFGALLQLVHEAAHGLLANSPRLNQLIAQWFCAYPLGVNFTGYVRTHRIHHAHANTDKDPQSDQEKYQIADVRDPRLYLLFAKDLLGITALSVFFAYNGNAEKGAGPIRPKLQNFLNLALVQTVILTLFFQFDILEYILLWLIPAVSPHMVLMRIRGIAEHGLLKQLQQTASDQVDGGLYTRSFLTPSHTYRFKPLFWIEKTLIGSFSVHYHHEHHLFPGVPHYRLREIHQAIAEEVKTLNPRVYEQGYFSAFLRCLAP